MTRLTKKRLEAMQNAISAMLSGEQGEGDWDPDVSREALEAADDWVNEKLRKLEKQ